MLELLLTISILISETSWKSHPAEFTVWLGLNLTALQTKTETCAKSVDPDEMAHSVTDFYLKPLTDTTDVSKYRDGIVHVRNFGVKVLMAHQVKLFKYMGNKTKVPTRSPFLEKRILKSFTIYRYGGIFVM